MIPENVCKTLIQLGILVDNRIKNIGTQANVIIIKHRFFWRIFD